MRRSRTLTRSERWELGLVLALMVVGCLCGAAILKSYRVPYLFSAASRTPRAEQSEPMPRPAAEPAAQVVRLAQAAEPEPVPQVQVEEQAPAPEPVEPAAPAPVRKALAPQPRKPAPEIKVYNGQRYRFARTLRLRVTAYSPDGRCCWPYPGTTTASGLSVKTNRGRLVAADTRLIPMHSLVSVPGYHSGTTVPVLDRGGAIKGHRLDVLLPTYEQAKAWGSRILDVKIYEPID